MSFFRVHPLSQRMGANLADALAKTGWISLKGIGSVAGSQNFLHANFRQGAFATPNLKACAVWASDHMMNSRQKIFDEGHKGKRFFSEEWRRKNDHYAKKAKELGMRSR